MTPLTYTRTWQVQALLASASAATPLSTELGQCFISIPLGNEAHQVIPLKSNAFRNWLLERFYTEHQIAPPASALRDVIGLLEAQSQFGGGPRTPVTRRIARGSNQSILLDLYNDAGQAVAIQQHGWSIIQNLAAHFRSTRSARPLPQPEAPQSGALRQFRTLLNLPLKHFTHCMSWLNAAMSPTGPYPILVLQGPASPARTALAHVLRSLIDPGPAPFCPLPKSVRDLHSLATHNWILSLDHIECIPAKVLRELVDFSTGAVIAARDSSSDPEPFHVYLQRPMLFATADPLPSGIGLAERAFVIPVAVSATISLPAFEQIQPQILGMLCDMASHPAPQWMPAPAAPDPVATALATFLKQRTEWTGTATQLLQALPIANPTIQWPETAKGLTQLLNRTPLGMIDFQSLKDARSRRTIQLRLIKPEPSQKRHTRNNAPMRVKSTGVHSR